MEDREKGKETSDKKEREREREEHRERAEMESVAAKLKNILQFLDLRSR